jgi:hypothetical protein
MNMLSDRRKPQNYSLWRLGVWRLSADLQSLSARCAAGGVTKRRLLRVARISISLPFKSVKRVAGCEEAVLLPLANDDPSRFGFHFDDVVLGHGLPVAGN